MSKQVVRVHGEDILVREDTAKSFRGVYWALISLALFVLIAAILFLGGFLRLATDQSPERSPAVEREAGR